MLPLETFFSNRLSLIDDDDDDEPPYIIGSGIVNGRPIVLQKHVRSRRGNEEKRFALRLRLHGVSSPSSRLVGEFFMAPPSPQYSKEGILCN